MKRNKFLNLTLNSPNDESEQGIYFVKKQNSDIREIWVVKTRGATKLFATSDYYTTIILDKKFDELSKDVNLKYEELTNKLEEYFVNIEPLSIRRLYANYQEMLDDKNPTDQNTGKPLTFGNLVSVHKDTDDSKNGVYTYTNPGWVYLAKLGDMSDMVTKSTDQVIKAVKTFEQSPQVPLAEKEFDATTFGQLEEVGKWTSSNEWAYAFINTKEQVIWGVRRDGSVYQPYGTPEEVRIILDSIQEIVETNTEDISNKVDKEENKSLIDNVFATYSYSINNHEYSYLFLDNNDKIVAAIKKDGTFYIPKKQLLDIIEDLENRLEITIDAQNKLVSYRDEKGFKHELAGLFTKAIKAEKITVKNKIDLTTDSLDELKQDLIKSGFKGGDSDWSLDNYIEIPKPLVSAKVNFISKKMPTTKTEDIKAEIEYFDKLGNYFKKPIIWNCQGSSSMGYVKKNFKFDLDDGSEIKIGNWVSQDSFHLKAYYIDIFRGQNNVCYNLCEQIYQTRKYGEKRPWDYLLGKNTTELNSKGVLNEDFDTGALAHPDGFPIAVYYNNEFYGVYTWNLKKHRDNYYLDKSSGDNIMLDGSLPSSFWNDSINWTQFEIKNPKKLKDINEDKYDGDNPKELSNTDKLSKQVKDNIIRISKALIDIRENKNKETFEKYFNVPFIIDYFLEAQITYNFDGFAKNWIWCTWDGKLWTPTFYDQDSVFGMFWRGTYIIEGTTEGLLGTDTKLPTGRMYSLYKEEVNSRYKELRDLGVISVENIIKLFEEWVHSVGYDNYKKEIKQWRETPSYRTNNTNSENWELVSEAYTAHSYDDAKTYNKGETCVYKTLDLAYKYRAKKETKGVPPIDSYYKDRPQQGGFYNSILRVEKWLELRIIYCDKMFNYKIN